MRRWIAMITVFAVLVGIFTLSPLLIGIWLKNHYQHLLRSYDLPAFVQIRLVDFQRGWFNSRAIMSVTVETKQLHKMLHLIGYPNQLPDQLNFVIHQKIFHGPVIYHAQDFPSSFALAAFYNVVQLGADTKNFFQQEGTADATMTKNVALVSYFGNYFKDAVLANLKMNWSSDNESVQLQNGHSQVWFYPRSSRANGAILLQNLIWVKPKDFFIIPKLTLQFDQRYSPQGLLVGNDEVDIPGLIWVKNQFFNLAISKILFKGDINENNGDLNLSRQLDIDKIEIENYRFGPLHLKLSGDKLNVQAIIDLMQIYNEILRRGEFYQSELKLRILYKLPNLIKSGSVIQVHKMELNTPYGVLQLNADVKWPRANFVKADNLSELIDHSRAYASVMVAEKLAEKMVKFVSETSYFREVPQYMIDEIQKLEQEATYAMQQNAFFLASLVDARELYDEDGSELLELMKSTPLEPDYLLKIKKLLLTRAISQQNASMLSWQYFAVKNLITKLEQRATEFQYAIYRQLQKQLDDYVRKGFIKKTNGNYYFTVVRDNGVTTMNGKQI